MVQSVKDATRGVTVRDISATGIGLVSNCPAGQGTILIIRLTGDNEVKRLFRVRVKHCTSAALNSWLLGCEFVTRLNEEELGPLLGQHPVC